MHAPIHGWRQRGGWHSARRPSHAMMAFSRYGNLPAREPAFSTERATTQASDGWSHPTPLARSLALEEAHRVRAALRPCGPRSAVTRSSAGRIELRTERYKCAGERWPELQLTQRRQVEVFVEVFVLFVQISLQDGPRPVAGRRTMASGVGDTRWLKLRSKSRLWQECTPKRP